MSMLQLSELSFTAGRQSEMCFAHKCHLEEKLSASRMFTLETIKSEIILANERKL